ncbi:DUF362 domain-containing protein [Myxococcota bacterium]|nr:DUF362 domain-containing protein [Myxococcota bacterium]MBU1380887.1 DUF362 domain-containing protein [Myxococcota bacterium]MBU1497015.1 DUF362 domain-containing protein [Myxococcota bacterium]
MKFKKKKAIEVINRRNFILALSGAVLATACSKGEKSPAGKPGTAPTPEPTNGDKKPELKKPEEKKPAKTAETKTDKIRYTSTIKVKTPAEVYFTKDLTPDGVMKVYEKIKDHVKGRVGFKVHFGEHGNTTYIKPHMMKKLVKHLKATLVETNVLYVSRRKFKHTHIKLAKEHGFDFAPIDILDGDADMELNVNLKHYGKIKIGKNTANYDMFLIFSHFKGHGSAGFGGAIKNVSMGIGSSAAKMAMHARTIPAYEPDKCIKCGICVKKCPANAITLKPLRIDPDKCIGCGACISECPYKVISSAKGDKSTQVFLERLVEYTKAIIEYKPCVYINVLANITSKCDCMGRPMKPFMPDIGILASTDIVAIDRASLDLVNKKHKCKDAFLKESRTSGNHQLDYAEKMGIGTQKYTLIDLDKTDNKKS